MKTWLQTLVVAAAGGAAVWAAFWLLESVLPQMLFVPLEPGRITILLALLAAGAILVWREQLVWAVALLAGSGAAWALHEVDPLSLCQSDLLSRPCTVSEISWMVVPPVLVFLAALAAAALAQRRRRAQEQRAA